MIFKLIASVDNAEDAVPPGAGQILRPAAQFVLHALFEVHVVFGPVGEEQDPGPAPNGRDRQASPIAAVVAEVAVVPHYEEMPWGNDDRPEVVAASRLAEAGGVRRDGRRILVAGVPLVPGNVVHEDALVHDPDDVPFRRDHPFDELFAAVLEELEGHGVALLGVRAGQEGVLEGQDGPGIGHPIDEQEISDEDRIFHRRRRHLGRLGDERIDEKDEESGLGEQLDVLAKRAPALGLPCAAHVFVFSGFLRSL